MIGKQGRAQMGHIDHLLVVEGRRAGIGGERADGRGRSGQPQPACGLALRIQLDAVVRLAALGFKAQVAGTVELAAGQKLSGA